MSKRADSLNQDLKNREKQVLVQRYLQHPLSVRWSTMAALVQTD